MLYALSKSTTLQQLKVGVSCLQGDNDSWGSMSQKKQALMWNNKSSLDGLCNSNYNVKNRVDASREELRWPATQLQVEKFMQRETKCMPAANWFGLIQ